MLVAHILIKFVPFKNEPLRPLFSHINRMILILKVFITNLKHISSTSSTAIVTHVGPWSWYFATRVHFKKANLVHNYSTRMASKGGLHHGKINTLKHGIKSFKYQGVKILNDLKHMSIYQNSTSKRTFIKELKSDLTFTYVE